MLTSQFLDSARFEERTTVQRRSGVQNTRATLKNKIRRTHGANGQVSEFERSERFTISSNKGGAGLSKSNDVGVTAVIADDPVRREGPLPRGCDRHDDGHRRGDLLLLLLSRRLLLTCCGRSPTLARPQHRQDGKASRRRRGPLLVLHIERLHGPLVVRHGDVSLRTRRTN